MTDVTDKLRELAKDPFATQEMLEAISQETKRGSRQAPEADLAGFVGTPYADYAAVRETLHEMDQPCVLLNARGTIVADNNHATFSLGSIPGNNFRTLGLSQETSDVVEDILRSINQQRR